MRKMCGRTLVTVLTIGVLLTTLLLTPAFADEGGGSSKSEDASLGVASALLTIPYGVAKIVYAGLGGIVGGLTWVLTGGNTEAAKAVWEPSFYGTYVITPDHLRGNEPVRFFGTPPYDEAYAGK